MTLEIRGFVDVTVGWIGILRNLVDLYWRIRVTSCLCNHGRSALMMEAAGFSEACMYIHIHLLGHIPSHFKRQ